MPHTGGCGRCQSLWVLGRRWWVLTIEAQHSNSSIYPLPPSSPLHREVAELRIPLIITSSVAEKYDEVALRSKPPIHFHFTDGEQGSISPLHSYQRSYLMSWRTNRCIALPHVMAYKQVHCITSCHGVQTGALHYLMSWRTNRCIALPHVMAYKQQFLLVQFCALIT